MPRQGGYKAKPLQAVVWTDGNMKFWFVTSVLLPVASDAAAANLIVNPDFDEGLTAWTTGFTGNGTVGTITADGSAAAPSAQLAVTIYPGQASLRQCVSLAGVAPPWDFGVRERLVANLGVCQPRVVADFSDTA